MTSSDRRRFLKLIGATGVGVGLAGCGSDGNGDDDDGGNDNDDTDDTDTTDGTTDGTDDTTGNETEDGTDEETDDETDGEETTGSLRVAHLSPDAPNVDVYVDEDPVLEDVPFGTFSEYLELAPGTYGVQITAAGDPSTVVFDEDVELTEGSFTAAALGELEETNQPFSVEVFEDDLSDPGEEARVRAIHASPDAPNVDITVAESGDALFEDVAFGDAGATTVPAGSYTLEIRAAGEEGDPVATFDVELASGTVYTAAAAGYLDPATAPADVPFDLLVVNDSNGEMMNDDEETDDETDGGETTGQLRVAHLSPDAPNVDVYVDEEPVLEDVPFGTFSEYLELAPGTYGVQITAAGDPSTVVFDEDVELTEGSFTAAALGEVAETNQPFAVELIEDDVSDPGQDARVQVIHASPDAPNVDITVAASGDALFEDVPFAESASTTVPAGQYTLEIRAAGEQMGEPVGTVDVDLAGGMIYTAAAVGYIDPTAAPANEPFNVVVTDSESTMTNGEA